LRTSLLVLCVGLILILAAWNARRLIHKFDILTREDRML
jgi:hypothetical protein